MTTSQFKMHLLLYILENNTNSESFDNFKDLQLN